MEEEFDLGLEMDTSPMDRIFREFTVQRREDGSPERVVGPDQFEAFLNQKRDAVRAGARDRAKDRAARRRAERRIKRGEESDRPRRKFTGNRGDFRRLSRLLGREKENMRALRRAERRVRADRRAERQAERRNRNR